MKSVTATQVDNDVTSGLAARSLYTKIFSENIKIFPTLLIVFQGTVLANNISIYNLCVCELCLKTD